MHRSLASLVLVSALASAGFSFSPTANAAAQRTFVASYGSPANTAFNCSTAKPCRAFSEAIGVTNANGEVIVLDSAGYGPVTITKSVSIVSPAGIYAGISVTSGDGVTINAPGATVVLRGLSINGQGGANGILLKAANRVRVENCVIFLMGAQGIYHQADNAEMIVLDTVVRDNGDGGIALVASDASIILDHVRSEHNVNAGLYAAPTPGSSYVRVDISDSLFAQNGGNGIWADSVGASVTYMRLTRSILSENGAPAFYATAAASSARIKTTVSRNSIHASNGGVRLLGIAPGNIDAFASDNVLSEEASLDVDGSGTVLDAAGTTGGFFLCANSAQIRVHGNNHILGVGKDATCIVTPVAPL